MNTIPRLPILVSPIIQKMGNRIYNTPPQSNANSFFGSIIETILRDAKGTKLVLFNITIIIQHFCGGYLFDLGISFGDTHKDRPNRLYYNSIQQQINH